MFIPRDRLQVRFSRSGGPGGQNVNRVATKVEVRFRLDEADWISARVRARLAALFPGRLTSDGDFVVVSSRFRTQQRNLEDCIEKLRGFLVRAAAKPRRRVPTRPTLASRKRRLEEKKQRGQRKRDRGWRNDDA